MNTERNQTLNYEKPEIIEIELAPQGVLCGSDVTIGVGGEQPDTEE